MHWTSLVSTQNLKLAWRRINTARNLQYKRFFREAYLVYESSLDEHLRELHKTLKSKTWQPSHATRVYLPKPSGLQRPLSLLAIEDQILLQAIANKFAAKLSRKRKQVELETVFSNKLADPKDSIFFTDRWQTTYRAFQDKCTDAFNQGYRWCVHFDLSAFYDTISHDLLLAIGFPKNREPEMKQTIREWLQVWSADNIADMTGHGIPQGPVASDFLAEAFFLPVDLRLQRESFRYLRYVDDIRLFARSENEVRVAMILLEQVCRHRGLIPQSAKIDVRELKSPEEAMGSLPSIAPTNDRDASELPMTAQEARALLATAIDGRPQKVVDKARFRYVMYRAPKDTKTLTTILRLVPRHPEHIDAFVAYFANYEQRCRIARVALDYLESGIPYSYVRGELWHLIARLGGDKEMRRALPTARQDARRRKSCVAMSWGVMHFLMKCEAKGIAHIGRRLSTEHPISRSLLAPAFGDREFTERGSIPSLLKGSLMEQLAGARELQKRQITLNTMKLRQRDLPPSCRRALSSLGVIRRQHRGTQTDWIGNTIVSLYGCRQCSVWRALFGTEYEHALQILIEAKTRFPGAYSDWLSLQDSFNDILVRQFFGFLQRKGLAGHSKTSGKSGRIVNLGTLIASGTPFDTAYQKEARALRTVHNRRNRLPGSHPYDAKGGGRNRWLSRKERDALLPHVRNVLDGISTVFQQNS